MGKCFAVIFGVLALISRADAFGLAGSVRTDNSPVSGVMVTVQNMLTGNNGEAATISVFTDEGGNYQIELDEPAAVSRDCCVTSYPSRDAFRIKSSACTLSSSSI